MKGIEYYRKDSFDMIEIKTCCDNLHSYKTHFHQELSIGYITKGSTILDVNGKEYLIRSGEAVIIYPFVSHKCQPIDINNWEFTMIYIDKEFCKEIFDNLVDKNSIRIKKLCDNELEQIKYLSDFLRSDSSLFDKEAELINTLNKLLVKCDIGIQFGTSIKINSIKRYIEDHFLDTIQLKDIEDKFNINRFSLIRSFKRKFNTTPNAYQLQLRVNYGKKLLKRNNDIADIALIAGFYDQAHFTKEFKKVYGVTPLQYYKSIN